MIIISEIIAFLKNHVYFTFAAILLNIVIISQLYCKISVLNEKEIKEAKGRRGEYKSYKRYLKNFKEIIKEYDKKAFVSNKETFYLKVSKKVKKAGYKSDFAAVIYIVLQYIAPTVAFIVTLVFTFPSFKIPLSIAVLIYLDTYRVVKNRIKKLNNKLQMSIYRIYKYLHNQISAGVKVTDAIKTIYEVVDDRDLKEILIRFAARYELTSDIDSSIEDFRDYFDSLEAETLTVAIKQGIETGDNQNILLNQEEVMFKKYLNYIQTETEYARTKSTISIVFFMLIIIIMVAVPMFKDMGDAMQNLFVN